MKKPIQLKEAEMSDNEQEVYHDPDYATPRPVIHVAPIEYDPKTPSGAVTVKQLREFLSHFPDDSEVWVGDGANSGAGVSSPCRLVSRLNACDVILEQDSID